MFVFIMFVNGRRFLLVSVTRSCIVATSRTLRSSFNLWLTNTGWIVRLTFKLRLFRRYFTTFAESWSLNGSMIPIVSVSSCGKGMCCWSDTLESTSCLTVELIGCCGYLSFENTSLNHSHSCEKYDQSDNSQ